MWGNKRAEIWGTMREWLKTASIPKERLLKQDLIGPQRKPNSAGVIFLETKKEMKARGLASPDAADAIAVSLAFPVVSRASIDPVHTVHYADDSPAVSWMGA